MSEMENQTLKELLSGLLNLVVQLVGENRHNDGSHEVKSFEVERIGNEIHNTFVYLSNGVDGLQSQISTLQIQVQRYKQAPDLPHIKGGRCNTAHSACDCMIQQVATLQAELDDYHNAEKFVADPPHDEVHCGCVGILRKQLTDLQDKVKVAKGKAGLWEKRVGEAAKAMADYEDLQLDLDRAHGYASRLFSSLAPQCEPLDNILGVLTQIDNWSTQLRWIPVSERLPERVYEVLVYYTYRTNQNSYTGIAKLYKKLWYSDDGKLTFGMDEVTHWREIDLPTGEDSG